MFCVKLSAFLGFLPGNSVVARVQKQESSYIINSCIIKRCIINRWQHLIRKNSKEIHNA